MSEVGFTNRQESRATEEIPRIGVGMLGYAFMGKAHANAYRTLAYMTWPPPLVPELVAIAGRTQEAVAEAAARYGFADHVTDWNAIVADDRIGLFDNVGPNNLHAAPTIAAAEAGKHVICEKPLGRDADESYETWQRVQAAGVKHMCAFNYRFVPAVRLAREMIEAGELGEILHFRGAYLQEWGATDAAVWRFDPAARGVRCARRPRRPRHRPGPLPRRRDRNRRGAHADVPAGARGRRRGRVGGVLRGRRDRHDRGVAVRDRAQERLHLGDQRLQGLDPLRSRAPQRARGPPRRLDARRRGRRASAPSSSRRPTTRSGSTGGRRATSSGGSTPSCTSCTTCSPRSATTRRSARMARRSRTAIARPRSATRCCAHRTAGPTRR